ncbi:MAG TPA: SH3 domain-containing protein [Stellaceae bacterium]|nr:SH3 domain-containing protein [Stellaceae bacterium]
MLTFLRHFLHARPLWPHLAGLLFALALGAAAEAADKAQPVPRFATLRADEVNLRTGPGERYPIDWVLSKKGLPVEIIGEYDVWRKVHDSLGSEGWVHERMITSSRNVVVTGQIRTLRADPDGASSPVARAEPGVVARLLECRGAWCRVETQDIKGWIKRAEIWGVYPDEIVQ